ncbi:bifunctional diaminohydroxyphosphoribosylaminopyrimidine deaminase/5-amino-6-(5-phosphoribosylamino)uracil reductase RibD [Kordiimonas pumila]|uniref:Riboflavin biosynthesis protein RibD n=1 Tax=Kordiimonas pumila TaxID=2161677 RepID=A0ABV7D1Y7_9PROT|nr:bifunctional diaminohydroxyphosphoribosylaminopyrimidine deaminase/5-amino-6-(5-phosphoribosylamino)uracil reductase RibD [Kordiimonas pumila]
MAFVDDIKWMRHALALAARGLGNVAPNPAVGCLLVKGGVIIGRGWTQPGGRPHAETVALDQAGENTAGATAFVTLEPCSHFGKTPPCVDALIKARLSRVVVAVEDIDSRVNGAGIRKLRAAGVEVTTGVLEAEARAVNAGFFNTVIKDRPLFSLKIASSLDGKIATATGESKWITGIQARRYGHMLRYQHDAILVGVNTVLADNPDLRCRITGLEKGSPIRIVLDSSLQTPIDSALFKTASAMHPVMIISTEDKCSPSKVTAVAKIDGVELVTVANTYDLKMVATILAAKGITRCLIEGGAQVYASFFREGLVDVLYHFTAGKAIGAEGINAIGNLSLADLAHAPHLKQVRTQIIGDDLLATYIQTE